MWYSGVMNFNTSYIPENSVPPEGFGFIYTLCDNPWGDSRVRYVGLTRTSIRQRKNKHISRSGSVNYPSARWVKKRNGKFHMQVLAVIPSEELPAWERYYIRYYRERGQADLNITDGGEEGPRSTGNSNSNAVLTEEQVVRIKLLLHRGNPIAQVARWFGAKYNTVWTISSDNSWVHVPWPDGERTPPRSKKLWSEASSRRRGHKVTLSPESRENRHRMRSEKLRMTDIETVKEIKSLLKAGTPRKIIATQLGVRLNVVHKIAQGRSYQWVE